MPLYCVSTVLVSVVWRRPISIPTKVYIAAYMVERLHLQHVNQGIKAGRTNGLTIGLIFQNPQSMNKNLI